MLRIRLQRTGNRNNPTFRLVVTDKRNAAKGKSKEILGHYLPTRDPVVFEFDKARVEHWIGHGAAPTDTVARLFSKEGIKGIEKHIERYTKQRKKKEVEKEAPAAPAPAEESSEAPAEDAAAEEKPTEEPKEEDAKQEPKEDEASEEKADEPAKEEEATPDEAASEAEKEGDDKKEE